MKQTPKQLARLFIESVQEGSDKDLASASDILVAWLGARGELKRLRDVIRGVEMVWKEKFGIANVEITSAHPLSKTLKASLEKLAHGASVTEVVDPSLIGGARLCMDEQLIDSSVSGSLSRLKKSLSS